MSFRDPRVLAILLAVGCSTAPPKSATPTKSTTVTVLDPMWMTGEQATQVPPKAKVERVLRSLRGVRVNPGKTPLRPSAETACQQDSACIRGAGLAARADKVMVLSLAELGDTVLVKLTVVEARGAAKEQTYQRVAKTNKLESTLTELTKEAARPFTQPEPKRSLAWYERWWVWAGTAAVAAGATVAILLTAGDDDPTEPKPDVVVTPP